MDKPLLAPQAPFKVPLQQTVLFSNLHPSAGVFQLAIMSVGTISFLAFSTREGRDFHWFELAPDKVYVFEISPVIIGFYYTSDADVYAYIPGESH